MPASAQEIRPSAADRLMMVLTAFTASRSPMSLTELAEQTGLPLSTTHRITTQLCRWGALQRREDKRFSVGPQLDRLAHVAAEEYEFREIATPFMQDVFAITDQNVQLTVRDGDRVLCLEKLRGHQSVLTTTRVGTHRFLHATSSGKLFLAYSDTKLIDSVLASGLQRCTQSTITSPGALAQSINRVRETGVGYAIDETAVGISAVAAPIFSPAGRVLASLGVVAPSSTDVRSFSRAVRQAARGATQQIEKQAGN